MTAAAMPSKKVRRVVTSHQLNAEEAAEARRLHKLIAKHKDEIIAEGRALLAEECRRQACA